MNKKLLAAAVAAAVVAAPAAFADSIVYGKFHASVDSVDIDDVQDNWEVNSRASRLGFKGSEDLGNGLKAIYQLELSVDVTDGGGVTGTNRNTFIGLAGDWGTALVGRHDTPAKVAFYGAGTDLLGDSIIDLNTGALNPIGVFTERRVDDAIAYISPNFSGFTFAGAVVPGEESGMGNDDNDSIADSYSLGGMYSGGGLKLSAGYEDVAGSGGAEDDEMWQVGGSYTMNAFTVGANYEDREMNGADYTAWAVVGKFGFGNNAISVVYTDSETDSDTAGADVDTSGWGVAAEHNFSKRTKAYVAYAANNEDPEAGNDTDDTRFSLGMIHSF